ncbi:MAG TPA: aromatic ring-hydroxylating dioxygenase subunit alpha [Nocardioides sp.]|jgi:vanillate O-demethylase monooxygenase subunit|uniref:aromatic ring-hydroxylating dioxygenase subunit alpha n=1 Tax=Nocardioides sp. TaxID=35761 RepID=UPI002E354567|nr:aromatic ring-hydroxylating dioxygenase subunit alpha [Nocardioides sp.]HEX3930792.1 aromatic ring-hydroxylating dioxygenase subunit alpha [Nocardioides sp.]
MSDDALRERVNAKIFPHPLDTWYAVAWDHEVTHRGILARTVAGRPMALYRTEAGRPVALADACWHRLAPLSMGKLVGADEIQCPYHGLRYNPSGRCTRLPAQETLNPSASVPSYPIVERHRYLWVWPGEPARADPAAIPDMHQMDDPAWAGDGLTIEARCNYQLILDNLMDLTHEEFVHGSTLGQDELSQSEFSTRLESDDHVSVTRWMIDVAPPSFWAKNIRDRFPDFSGRVDRWQIIHYYAPSTICIDVGVAPTGTGAPEGDRSQGVNGYVMNTITPETERSSHYFWAFMRNYRLSSQQITTELRNGVKGVFGEDEVMLQAQQQAIDANPDYAFYSLNIDAGGMWVRRILDRMLAAEGALDTPRPAAPPDARALTGEPAPPVLR